MPCPPAASRGYHAPRYRLRVGIGRATPLVFGSVTHEFSDRPYHVRGTSDGIFGEVLWTEDCETHIARHYVTPLEVEQALYTRPRLIAPGRNDTVEVLGTSNAGRHLLVVVAESADGRDCIITARDMTPAEKRTFREKGH